MPIIFLDVLPPLMKAFCPACVTQLSTDVSINPPGNEAWDHYTGIQRACHSSQKWEYYKTKVSGGGHKFDLFSFCLTGYTSECSASCTYVPPTAADRCSLPHEPGHCNSDIERWFFDWEKKQCVCRFD